MNKEYYKQYYQRNKERIRQRTLEWNHNNPEKLRKYHIKYYQDSSHRLKEIHDSSLRTYRLKLEIFEILGNKCSNPHCLVPGGCIEKRCLQIDHINNNGNKERKTFTRWSYYKHVLEDLRKGNQNYALLCANCNWIKRREIYEEISL